MLTDNYGAGSRPSAPKNAQMLRLAMQNPDPEEYWHLDPVVPVLESKGGSHSGVLWIPAFAGNTEINVVRRS